MTNANTPPRRALSAATPTPVLGLPAGAAATAPTSDADLRAMIARLQADNEALKAKASHPGSPRKTEVGVRFVPYAGRPAQTKTINGIATPMDAKPPCEMLQIQTANRGVPVELTVSPGGYISIGGVSVRPVTMSAEAVEVLLAHAEKVREFTARNASLLARKR